MKKFRHEIKIRSQGSKQLGLADGEVVLYGFGISSRSVCDKDSLHLPQSRIRLLPLNRNLHRTAFFTCLVNVEMRWRRRNWDTWWKKKNLPQSTLFCGRHSYGPWSRRADLRGTPKPLAYITISLLLCLRKNKQKQLRIRIKYGVAKFPWGCAVHPTSTECRGRDLNSYSAIKWPVVASQWANQRFILSR